MKLNSAKDLDVYKKAYRLAMDIFELLLKTAPTSQKSSTVIWYSVALK
jgi:hypothetical protein